MRRKESSKEQNGVGLAIESTLPASRNTYAITFGLNHRSESETGISKSQSQDRMIVN